MKWLKISWAGNFFIAYKQVELMPGRKRENAARVEKGTMKLETAESEKSMPRPRPKDGATDMAEFSFRKIKKFES